MSNLLSQNNLEFFKRKDIKGDFISATKGGAMSDFLEHYDINNYLDDIEKINMYIMGKKDINGDNSINAEIYTAYMDHTYAYIYYDLDQLPNNCIQRITLSDFKEILTMWVNFCKF